MSSSPTFLDPVVIPMIRGETVLDVACGYGRWGNLIRTNFWEAGLKTPPAVDGFDAFEPNLDLCQRGGSYRKLWHHFLPSPLEGQWDTVLACEILEHLHEPDAVAAIEVLERAARQRVIISTPNWEYLRSGGETVVGYNDYEAHHSHLPRRFFHQRGYTIVGAGFGNPRSLFCRVVNKFRLPGRQALGSLPLILPSLGIAYVAYKDIGARLS